MKYGRRFPRAQQSSRIHMAAVVIRRRPVGRVPDPRLPVAPLERYLETVVVPKAHHDVGHGEGLNALWPVGSWQNRAYWRAKQARSLTVYTADHLAIDLGLHPCLIWGDAWWEPNLTETAADALASAA